MEKILIWYLDLDGDSRVQVVEKNPESTIDEFLKNWWKNLETGYNLIEAYTLAFTHEVSGHNHSTMKVTTISHEKGEKDVF